jgi:hypothetical protein
VTWHPYRTKQALQKKAPINLLKKAVTVQIKPPVEA